ncbi:MAG: hypothetical protein Q4D04_02280 [Clostridia bacterium]|nr:hypothetical protein [Clostridia bacterium]
MQSVLSGREDILGRLDKMAKRQNKVEIICEDILELLNESHIEKDKVKSNADMPLSVPGELFCEVLEAYDILSGYCEKSEDGELSAQTPFLNAKVNHDMSKRGFSRIDKTGVLVDTRLHEINCVYPAPDAALVNTVKHIIIAGCTHGDIVIKRAIIEAYGGEEK